MVVIEKLGTQKSLFSDIFEFRTVCSVIFLAAYNFDLKIASEMFHFCQRKVVQ